VANGCTDRTVGVSKGFQAAFTDRGWQLDVIELEVGSKIVALNAGDMAADADVMVYLDADVLVDRDVLGQLSSALHGPNAAFGSGTLEISPPKSSVSRAYLRIYQQVPFITQGVPACGLFATNQTGRKRWADWPNVISDDTFARLNFSAEERHKVSGRYVWPIVEGWRALVRVRRRQNVGVDEIHQAFPALKANDEKPMLGKMAKLWMALRDPIGFAVYVSVAVATRLKGETGWSRGR
jgi:glycosyltransferase involved in cell wall biosynthesis